MVLLLTEIPLVFSFLRVHFSGLQTFGLNRTFFQNDLRTFIFYLIFYYYFLLLFILLNIIVLIESNKIEFMKLPSKSSSHQHKIKELLKTQQNTSQQILENNQAIQQIKQLTKKYEQKAYHFYLNQMPEYFEISWKQIITMNPEFQAIILDQMKIKTDNIITQILEDQLQIEQKIPLVPFDYTLEMKSHKMNILKEQSENIKAKINEINDNLSGNVEKEEEENNQMKSLYQKLFSEEKIKEAQEFVKKKREEQLQRKRKLKEQRKKQEEALQKKQQEIKQHQKELLRAKREEIIQKKKQLHEKRDQQKHIREQRNTDYLRMKKKIHQIPPLYQKIQDNFSKRYQNETQQKLKKMHSERKHFTNHIDNQILEKHVKNYEEIRQKKQKERQERIAMMMEEEKLRVKLNNSYEAPPKQRDPKEIEKEKAREKQIKILQYRAIVKEKFKPKVDQNKRKQLMNLIEEMEIGNHKVKKTKLPNGNVIFQKMEGDHKMLGMEYLEKVKEMAAKARLNRKNSFQQEVNVSQEQKKPKNYLEQLRKNRTKYDRPSVSVANMNNLSYDEKMQRIMQKSQRLAQVTRQNEMMLKFGKFKTSEEILQCKQEIDQNYINMVNMKLNLILNQGQYPNDQSELD